MRKMLVFAAAAALAGCSAQESQDAASRDNAPGQATELADAAAKPGDAPKPVKVSLPQLAYSYSLGFVLPGDRIVGAQDAHRALCERMGPARCQLLALERGGVAGESDEATMKVRVATAEARSFSDALTQVVSDAGGRAEETKVAADDVSKQIVDTKARIAQHELLVARLTTILRNRQGKVGELVEAERSVAAAQEELDQAKAWLNELGGRVAMSDVEIRYTAIAPTANGRTVAEATEGSAALFVGGVQTLLTLVIYLLPWGLIVVPVVLLLRRRKAVGTAA